MCYFFNLHVCLFYLTTEILRHHRLDDAQSCWVCLTRGIRHLAMQQQPNRSRGSDAHSIQEKESVTWINE